jgi:division protein CdvB (Snf7/Vps24/ESCRT-III family)
MASIFNESLMSFAKRWEKQENPSTYGKMVETIKPSDPLKSKLVDSIQRIELENQRLDQALARSEKREKELFSRVVEAYKAHDEWSANVYATEVAEIRKVEGMFLQSKLALEQIALRMKTSTELGDVAVSLLPIVGVMKEIKSGIASISPQTEQRMGDLSEVLNGIVVDASMMSTGSISFDTVNDDASSILGEAQVVAESKIGDGFPSLPEKFSSSIREDDSKP